MYGFRTTGSAPRDISAARPARTNFFLLLRRENHSAGVCDTQPEVNARPTRLANVAARRRKSW